MVEIWHFGSTVNKKSGSQISNVTNFLTRWLLLAIAAFGRYVNYTYLKVSCRLWSGFKTDSIRQFQGTFSKRKFVFSQRGESLLAVNHGLNESLFNLKTISAITEVYIIRDSVNITKGNVKHSRVFPRNAHKSYKVFLHSERKDNQYIIIQCARSERYVWRCETSSSSR